MNLDRALMLVTVLSLVTAFYFAGQAREAQSTLAKVSVIRHGGQGEWIEIIHRGEIVSEWQPRDGEVYEVLDSALHGGE